MSLADIGLVVVQPCEMEANCTASPNNRGEAASSCSRCKWSPEEPENGRDLYRPIDKRAKFDRKDQQDYQDRRQAVADKQAKKASRNKKTSRIVRSAARAEKRTELNIIKSTRNSGRTNKDGDHVSAGCITLDTKEQSGNINPVVKLDELAKVHLDAKRVGNPIGGLVLRNKNGVGVVVFSEDDWAKIATWISQ